MYKVLVLGEQYGRGSSGDINVENTNTSVTEGGWISIAGYMGNTANSGFYHMAGITAKKSTTAGDGNYGGDLSFWTTSGGANGEANSGMYQRMTIDSSGDVGIGSTNADSKFKVELNPSGTVLAGLRIGYNSSSANYFDGDTQYFRNGAGTTERMRITSGGDLCVGVTTALGRIHMHNSGTSYLHISNDTTGSGAGSGTDIGVFSGQSDLQINNREAASVIISTSDTPRLTINSSGNVGIGNTSPSAKLTIDNSISTSYSTTGYAATPANSMLYLNNTNGGSNTASLINFRTGSGDGVLGFVEGGGTNDADFVIQTDGGSNGIERFRITNAGNVGIGTTSPGS
jgi:hypothetical protein